MLKEIVKYRDIIIYVILVGFFLIPSDLLCLNISQKSSWPIDIGSSVFSSPIVSDLNGDGEKEVIAISFNNKIFIFSANGKKYVESGNDIKHTNIHLELILYDIDDDGIEELLTILPDGKILANDNINIPGTIRTQISGSSGLIYPFTTFDGKKKIATNLDKTIYILDIHSGEFSEIVIEYQPNSISILKDYDKRKDIVVITNSEGNIAGFNAMDGNREFQTVIGPIKYSKPVFADFNKDGEFEIYIASLDGKVYGINTDGRKVRNFPVKVGSGFLDGGIISTPAIADLNNDNDLELIVSTGILQSENGSLFIISGDGEIITEYLVKDSPIVSSPIVANMDNDNELEVCFITYEGKLIGLNYDGTVVKGLPQTLYGSLFSSTPVIDDIDNDDFGELITLSEDGFLDVYDMNVKYLESRWNMYGGGPSKERTYQTIKELQTFTLKKIIIDDGVEIEWNAGDLKVDSWNILYKNDVDEDYDEIVNLSSLYNRFNIEQLRWRESFYIKVVGIDDGDIICQSQDLYIEFEKETDELLSTEINNNYPNPFSESTTIVFTVGNYGKSYKDVDISIYDITGKKIAKILQTSYSSGEYSVIWDGNSDTGERVSSGVYFVQMICGGEVKNHRLILLRDK